MPYSEKFIETYLIKKAKGLPALCWKFTSPANAGVPDRIILYKGSATFVECKAPGQKPRPIQISRFNELAGQEFPVHIVDSKERVDEVIEMIRNKQK